jgi:hypothetical protein
MTVNSETGSTSIVLMRSLSALLLLVPALGSAEPRPGQVVTLVDDVSTVCKGCKRIAQQKVDGVGNVEVYEDRDSNGLLVKRLVIAIPAVGRTTAAVLADFNTSFVEHAVPHIKAYDDVVVEGGKDVVHHDVGFEIDLDRRSASPYTRQRSESWQGHLIIACGSELVDEGTRLWNCKPLQLGADGPGCQVDKWNPPQIDYSCKTSEHLSAHGK